MEGNLCFKIDWASLIVGRKFTVFGLFYFVFEGNFQVQGPGGAYIWRAYLTEDFLRYEFGGDYIWRGKNRPSEYTLAGVLLITKQGKT